MSLGETGVLDPLRLFQLRKKGLNSQQTEVIKQSARSNVMCSLHGRLERGSRYTGYMPTMFINQSEEYVGQIDAEIERLQQLRDQVQTMIQSEEALEESGPQAPRKRAAKKSAGKSETPTKVPGRRGRPKSIQTTEA